MYRKELCPQAGPMESVAGQVCEKVPDEHIREFSYSRVIAVTNRSLCARPFLEQVERVCQVHPRALLLREKDLPETEYRNLGGAVLEICRAYQVPCIFHSFPGAARELKAESIHLPIHRLRSMKLEQLSDFSRIGCSIHSAEEAKEAQDLGATYLTAGHIYATDCKKGLPPRGLDFLKQVCENVKIPVYAIGGIRPDLEQLDEVLSTGARGVCIMSGMMRL